MRLEGIEGTHLLGFMASLGLITVLEQRARDEGRRTPRLAFHPDGCAELDWDGSGDELVSTLKKGLDQWKKVVVNELAAVDMPADFTTEIVSRIAATGSSDAVALVSGLVSVVGDTAWESTLCAANGAGHQALVQSFRDALVLVKEAHLRDALFQPWRRSWSPSSEERSKHGLGSRKVTLRLESTDERLYALRATDPTGASGTYETELGAQALAVPAFSILPIVPRRVPRTVASSGSRGRSYFHWGLWSPPCTLDAIRSLLWLGPGASDSLRARGMFMAFRVARVTGAKGKLSFAPTEGSW